MAFVVTAQWNAVPGEEHRIAEVIKIMTPLSREEPKNRYYQASVDPEDATRFFLFEIYEDAQGYEDHKASTYFQEHVFGYAIEYLAERIIKTYETIDV